MQRRDDHLLRERPEHLTGYAPKTTSTKRDWRSVTWPTNAERARTVSPPCSPSRRTNRTKEDVHGEQAEAQFHSQQRQEPAIQAAKCPAQSGTAAARLAEVPIRQQPAQRGQPQPKRATQKSLNRTFRHRNLAGEVPAPGMFASQLDPRTAVSFLKKQDSAPCASSSRIAPGRGVSFLVSHRVSQIPDGGGQ